LWQEGHSAHATSEEAEKEVTMTKLFSLFQILKSLCSYSYNYMCTCNLFLVTYGALPAALSPIAIPATFLTFVFNPREPLLPGV